MMVVPAMEEAQGTIGSLIKRRVEATTTCLAFFPQQTTMTASEPGFALRRTCDVTMYISAGHGRKLERAYHYRRGAGGADDASCFVVPGSGEDGVRDALRGMLRSIRALQDLGLTDAEWESIVPEDVVPQLADPRARRRHAAASVDLAVVRHIRYDAARLLMTGCKKIGDGAAEEERDVDVECSVCFDALRGEAVELPVCAHAFHRRCISKWFSRKPTCPLCRGDVVKHLDPELQKHITEFTDAM